MAKLGIYTGVSANDGLGDTLLTGAIKINSNFDELYDLLGTGGFLGDAHLDRLDVSGLSTFVGVSTFLSDVYIAQNLFVSGVNINSGSSIGVDILTRNINASGIVTVGGIVDLNSDLDVDGRTELDITNISETLNVVGVSTFGSNVDINAFVDISSGLNVVGISTFQNDIILGDGDKIRLGADGDLEIYHDGANSYISDRVSGDLILQGDASVIIKAFGSAETMGKFNKDGSVELYYNNSKKFETTSTGIDVTGTTQLDDLNVSGDSTITGNIDANGNLDVDGRTELDITNISETLSVSGISTFTSAVDINSDLDVDGITELDTTNISETLNVVGVSTFGSSVDINADLDVDGRTELDTTNISETLNVVGISTFGSDIDINASIDVDGHTELDDLNVSGVSTFASAVDINADLDVDGRTELDTTNISETLNVAGISTFGSDVDINANLDVSGTLTLGSYVQLNSDINITGVVTATAFHTGAEGSAIRITSDSITGPSSITIDPSGVGDNTGLVIVKGDLQVDGTQTVINSTVVEVTDLNITLASGAVNDAAADGGGITIDSGDGLKTFQFEATGDNFGSSENINLSTGKTYKIDNTEVLSSTQLTVSNINSSGIGTIETLDTTTGTIDYLSATNINLSGLSTFTDAVDINADLDVDGRTELDITNISETLNVVGVSTFGSSVDINADLDVDGFTELDSTNISETLNVVGVSTFGSDVDINANVDISGYLDVDGRTELDTTNISETLNVVGISTFGSNVDVNADLDVDGRTELDTTNISETLNVVGITTLNDFVNVLSNMSVSGVATITTIYGDFDGELNNPGSTYYVSVNGSDSHTGDNINQQFATLAHALSVATSGDTILVGSGTFNEVFPLTVPQGVSVRGVGLRATFIQPTTETRQNDGFLMNGETTVEDLTVGNMYEPGYAFKFADNCNTTTRSPYIQRVTVLNKGSVITSDDPYGFDTAHSPPVSYKAGRGVLIDGSVVAPTSLEPAMLFNECTFICPNNTALEMTNGARTEWVNCFTYFADKGIYAHDGNVGLASTGYVRIKTSGFSGTTPQANDELYYLQSNEVSATYNQVGTTITFTKVGHGLTVGDRVFADFTSGAASDGFYYIDTYIDADNFSVTSSSNTTSGNVSYKEALGFGTVRVYTPSTGLSSITSKGEGLFELPSTRLGKTVTAFGNAQLSTSEQKFGTSSLVLDGVGDYATVASNVDFGFGTSDFTLETFVRLDVTGTTQTIFDLRSGSSSDSAITVGVANTNVVSVSYGSTNIITGTTALTSGQWYHIAVSRSSSSTKLFVDGTQEGSTYADTNDYGVSKPLVIGSDYSGSNGFDGYIDETRISNNARYTGSFTPTTSAFNSDGNDKLLMHFDGITGSASFTDSSIPNQDIRWVRSGVGIATATKIILADYQQFGAAMRSIGSAVVFGNTGISADGPGVTLRMFAFNFGHIGAGKDFSQDISLVNQESEVVETNNANVYFTSIDQSGDFRVGDAFYVNQKSGTVNFGGQDFTLNSLSDLNITDGTNTNTITPTTATFGNIQIAGNEITSTSGDININPSGNSETNIDGNLNVSGILTASVLQTGALQLGDTSIVIEDSGSNGTIKLSTDSVEAVRIDDAQRVGIGSTIPTSKLDVVGDIKVSGVSTFTGISTFKNDLYVGGNFEVAGTSEFIGQATFRGGTINLGDSDTDDVVVGGEFASNLVPTNDGQYDLGTSGKQWRDLYITGTIDTDQLNVSGISTFTGTIDANGDLDVDGRTELDTTNISETLNVTGISTFASDVDINAGLDVDGRTELDTTNISETLSVVGISTFSSDIDINASIDVSGTTTTGQLNVTGVSTFQDNVNLGDNDRLRLGDGQDLQIYHNSANNNSIIQESGSGNLVISGSNIAFRNGALSEDYALFTQDGSVELYYDNSKKFETTGAGVTITGIATAATFYATNGTFAAGTDTATDAALILEEEGSIYTRDAGIYIRNLIQKKSDIIIIGQQNTVLTDGIELKPGSAGSVKLHAGGTSDNVKLQTTTSGIEVTGTTDTDQLNVSGVSTFQGNVNHNGDITLGDNDKIALGDGNDLQIYHNGSENYIDDAGVGSLLIRTLGNNNITLQNSTGNMLNAVGSSGSVELYYDNSKKFETTGAGVTVSGSVYISGVTTTTGLIDADGGINASSAKIEDLTNNRVVLAGTGGELQDNANLTFDGTTLSVTGSSTIDNVRIDGNTIDTSSGDITIDSTGGTVNVADQLVVSGISTFNSNVYLGDGGTIFFGTNEDFFIQHEGSYSLIQDSGTGPVYLQSDGTGFIFRKTDGEDIAHFLTDASVDLYYNASKKFETTNTGVKITGNLEFSTAGINAFTITGFGTNYSVSSNVNSWAAQPMATEIWHDLFAFQSHYTTTYETFNGSGWVLGTVNSNLFAQKEDQSITVATGSPTTAVRWTFQGTAWGGAEWLVIGHAWNSGTSNKTILVESGTDGSTWTTRHESTYTNTATSMFHYLGAYNGDSYIRVTITRNGSSTGDVNLSNIKLLTDRPGDQGQGKEYHYPYSWDGQKNITTRNNLTVPYNFSVSGLTTTSGLLDINAGAQANTFKVEDLTSGRIVLAGTGGELEDSGNLTFDGNNLSVTGNLNISGNLSYQDVTNVDSVGIITAQSGVRITNGGLTVTGVSTFNSDINVIGHTELDDVNVSGVVTATAFHTGAEGSAIRVTSDTISGPATINIDPAGVGDNTGTVVIKGDLQIDGTTTTVNSTTVTVDDKNIVLGSGAANDAAADGGGITLESGEGDKTFNWVDSTDSWTSSENFDLANTKTYKIAGTDVLSSTSLGTNVTTSFLTTVGTLTVLNVGGNVNVTGVSTFVGVTTFQANVTFQSDVLVEGSINSSTDVTIDGVSVLTSASDEAVALAIALG